MEEGLADLRLAFVSEALPEDTFRVVAFEGTEGISRLYAFTVELSSTEKDVDFDAVMGAAARLVLGRSQDAVTFHGILETFGDAGEASGVYFYRARLRPRLWRLTLDARNQVFVGKTLPEMLEAVLTGAGLAANAFSLRLQGSYPAREFVCQYRESQYDFLMRWMAHYGLYSFFEQGDGGETLVITDTKIAHAPAPGAKKLTYARTSGLETSHAGETVHDFGLRRTITPGKVTLKDYNYRKPGLDLTVEAALPVKGAGETYRFGGHYQTPDEGRKLAKLHTEVLQTASREAFGTSFVPWLRPGYTFEMGGHPNQAANGTYLVTALEHKGYAASAFTAGLGPSGPGEARLHYQNTFTATPAATQFRPQPAGRNTLAGLMNAHIDAAGSGTYAELDEAGRYRIRLPFDGQSALGPGKASAAVRMLTPHAGAGFGLHCPLHKGTEAALGYVDGNPDRPIILGAAPNPDHASQVNSDTQTQCRLTTASGHKLHIEDKEGSQRILTHCATGPFIRIGAHNDPAVVATIGDGDSDDSGYFSENGIAIYTPDSQWVTVRCKNEAVVVFGIYMLNILGFDVELRIEGLEINLAFAFAFYLANKVSYESWTERVEASELRAHPVRHVMHGSQQQINMQQVRTTLETSTTTLENTRATASKVAVAEAKMKLVADTQEATALKAQTCQTETQLAGEKTAAYQEALHSSQTVQDLAAQKVLMTQEHIDTTTERTGTYVSKTVTEQIHLQTSANQVKTAADELAFFGIYSKG